MATAGDVAIEDLTLELLQVEDAAVAALQEAVAWRQVALVALTLLQQETARADRAERRMRQFMGIDPMHPEQEAA